MSVRSHRIHHHTPYNPNQHYRGSPYNRSDFQNYHHGQKFSRNITPKEWTSIHNVRSPMRVPTGDPPVGNYYGVPSTIVPPLLHNYGIQNPVARRPLGNNGIPSTVVPQPLNSYGPPVTPGGARTTLASPTESLDSNPYSRSSSVLYPPPGQRYPSANIRQHPTPLRFEGVHPWINPAPSEGEDTVDYEVATANEERVRRVRRDSEEGYDGGRHTYTDHFPRHDRGSPDSMNYMHQAPGPRGDKKRDRPPKQNAGDGGCCVVS